MRQKSCCMLVPRITTQVAIRDKNLVYKYGIFDASPDLDIETVNVRQLVL